MTLDEISARLEIQDVIYRYCRGVDRGDLALLKSVYHPDATDDHGSFKGTGHAFAEYVVARMDATPVQGQHQVTNILIEVDGATAQVESYFIAFNPELDAEKRGIISIVTGRYLDRFEKRGGAWKIADRKVLIDWGEQGGHQQPWARLAAFTRGARGPADASHGLFKKAS